MTRSGLGRRGGLSIAKPKRGRRLGLWRVRGLLIRSRRGRWGPRLRGEAPVRGRWRARGRGCFGTGFSRARRRRTRRARGRARRGRGFRGEHQMKHHRASLQIRSLDHVRQPRAFVPEQRAGVHYALRVGRRVSLVLRLDPRLELAHGQREGHLAEREVSLREVLDGQAYRRGRRRGGFRRHDARAGISPEELFRGRFAPSARARARSSASTDRPVTRTKSSRKPRYIRQSQRVSLRG